MYLLQIMDMLSYFYAIGCDVGISVASGGQCDLTNNSSFGNFGLKEDGFGDIEFTG